MRPRWPSRFLSVEIRACWVNCRNRAIGFFVQSVRWETRGASSHFTYQKPWENIRAATSAIKPAFSYSTSTRSRRPTNVDMVNLTHLFRVETLDARFASNTGEPAPDAVPSKWNTWEYYVYYVVFLIIPPWMFKTVYDCSQPTHPGYQHYEHLLEPGWVPGRKVDNSDSQYSGFRENIPYMAILLLAHPLLRRAYEQMTSSGAQKVAKPNVCMIRPRD